MNRSINATLGHKVVSMDSAEDIGDVKSFVVDSTATRIVKVQVSGRKKNALFAAWADLRSFGDDAVMVAQTAEPGEAETDRDVDVAKGNIDIIGARILDTAGFERGTVDDAEFDADSGAIVAVHTDGSTIAASRLRSLGTYALVVDA